MIEGADGHLYGTRQSGGLLQDGYVFRLTRTGVFTKLHEVDRFEDGLSGPVGPLVQAADGALYGLSRGRVSGGTVIGDGAVFRVTLGGDLQRIGELGGELGSVPSGLTLASDGRLYGMTLDGPRPGPTVTAGPGVLFSLPLSGPPALTYNFSTPEPMVPAGKLVAGPDGKLYGTSCLGGLYNQGTVFRLDAPGVATTLHSFTGADGSCPASGLALGSDGSFYGTTLVGQDQAVGGTIYRITPDGHHTVLESFDASSEHKLPWASPTAGPDGRLYVPVSDIGAGAGAVLRIEPDGTVTTFAELELDGGYGHYPGAPLFLANDGNFYGTNMSATGGVFRLSLDGSFAPVHMFEDDEDATAVFRAGVVQAADGRLYGVTGDEAAFDAGRIYSTSLSGPGTVLHEFNYLDGDSPNGELVEISPGRLLGTTFGLEDPKYGLFGTIFEITTDGSFKTLHRFFSIDGANPFAGLTRTSAGQIYGVTTHGGPLGGGVIFRFVLPAASGGGTPK